MKEVNLPGLLAFECVARHLSFTRAADEQAVTPTAISKAVKQLEAQMSLRLFNRTTRSVALTEAGANLLARLAPALEQIRSGMEATNDAAGRPSGKLRINTSYVAYAALIEPNLAGFLDRYPEVELEVAVDNTLSDIVAAGFDVGVRLGHALQRDMISMPLGPPQQLIVVGAPAYLRRHGAPKTPQDLLEHDCINQRLNRARFMEWEFRGGSARSGLTVIDVRGRLVFDEMRATLSAAARGCGLAYVFRQFATPELVAGKVTAVLEKFAPPPETFHLYYANRAQMPAKLRAFIEFLRAVNWKVPK